ncbi:hypothetical protein D3C75_1166100 [compost metagenome]
MIVYIEKLHMNDVFSENRKSHKPLCLLHVSGVLEKLYFQFTFFELFLWIIEYDNRSTGFDTFIIEERQLKYG